MKILLVLFSLTFAGAFSAFAQNNQNVEIVIENANSKRLVYKLGNVFDNEIAAEIKLDQIPYVIIFGIKDKNASEVIAQHLIQTFGKFRTFPKLKNGVPIIEVTHGKRSRMTKEQAVRVYQEIDEAMMKLVESRKLRLFRSEMVSF